MLPVSFCEKQKHPRRSGDFLHHNRRVNRILETL